MGRLTGSTSLAGAKAPCHVVSGGPVSHQHHSCVPMHLQGEMSQGPLQAVVLGPLTGPKEALPSTTGRLVLEVLGSELSPLGEALLALAHRDTCQGHHTNSSEHKAHLVKR